MSSSDIDTAVTRVRRAVDDVVDEAEDPSDDVHREGRHAIVDLETHPRSGHSAAYRCRASPR